MTEVRWRRIEGGRGTRRRPKGLDYGAVSMRKVEIYLHGAQGREQTTEDRKQTSDDGYSVSGVWNRKIGFIR